jgi:hypothetical protein
MLWHENVGRKVANDTDFSDAEAVTTEFGKGVYSHIQRLVVVKEGHGFCLCL